MLSPFVKEPSRSGGSCVTRLAMAVGLFMVLVIAFGVILASSMTINPGSLLMLQCTPGESSEQTESSGYAEDSIPENYLELYKKWGEEKGVPWNILAGVGQVESKHGRWDGAGITEGHNDWGAAGPMQFGALDGSAAGNSWGGEPVMKTEDRPEEGYGQD